MKLKTTKQLIQEIIMGLAVGLAFTFTIIGLLKLFIGN